MATATAEPADEPAKVEVRIRCICPDPSTHPEGDVISLPAKLDFPRLATVVKSIRGAAAADPTRTWAETIFGYLSELYLRYCISDWTLKNGKPIAVTSDNVEKYLLSQPDVALAVSEEADNLYNAAVLPPLVAAAQRPAQSSSPPTRRARSTSARRAPGAKPSPKPSKRSSTTTTRTAATAPTV